MGDPQAEKIGHKGRHLPTRIHFIILGAIALILACPVFAENRPIVVALTPSTQETGLFNYLLPLFTTRTGISVKTLVLGTPQALETGRHGQADVILVHAKSQEQAFVADGFGVKRFPVMYNDMLLIGPKSDPAGIKGADIVTALTTIRNKAATFASHSGSPGGREADLWQVAGIDIAHEKGRWYRALGQGTIAALNAAATLNAYVLADRASWTRFNNKDKLAIDVEGQGDKRMANQYGAVLINPDKDPNVNVLLGQAFIDWLISVDGQKAIADFKIDGQQMFFPDANDPGA